MPVEKTELPHQPSALEASLKTMAEAVIQQTLLTYPDPSPQYILDTDASNEAAGAVLSQMVEGEECVVAY